jgi:hypothetical protein
MRILAIEGIPDSNLIENLLLKPLLRALPKVQYITKRWNEKQPPGIFDMVIGHSLGGHTAIDFANLNRPKWLVTIDPRWKSLFSLTDFLYPWQEEFDAPEDVSCRNFYRFGFMPGYRVRGAFNSSLNSTHIAAPGQVPVYRHVYGVCAHGTPR